MLLEEEVVVQEQRDHQLLEQELLVIQEVVELEQLIQEVVVEEHQVMMEQMVEAVHAAEAASQAAAVDAPDFLASLRVGAPHFQAAVARLGPAVLRGLAPEIPEVSFDQIGGLQVRGACVLAV